jgi:hypothetical protein
MHDNHVFNHVADYVALGILIVCMLAAGVRAIHKARNGRTRAMN